MQSKLGDATAIEMNTSRLDGGVFSLEELQSIAATAPFLAPRRLVVLSNPLSRLSTKALRSRFLKILESLPQVTALVIHVDRPLRGDHWLMKWAAGAGARAFVKEYRLIEGGRLARWIQEQAKQEGGSFTPEAAVLLSSIAGTDRRFAAQEISKLLAYINYTRPVESDDIQYLTVAPDQENPYQVFDMVDAIGQLNASSALNQLHQLLIRRDPLSLFGMIIRQFRLLLLTREILDRNEDPQRVSQLLNLHPYVAGKIVAQARNFDQRALESIYRRLLDLDEQIKSGRISPEVGLDTLIASLSRS